MAEMTTNDQGKREEECAWIYEPDNEYFHIFPGLFVKDRLVTRAEAEAQGRKPCTMCYPQARAEEGPKQESSPELLKAMQEKTAVLQLILKPREKRDES